MKVLATWLTYRIVLLFLAFCLPLTCQSDDSVRIVRTIAPQSEEDVTHKFFISIIEIALKNAEEKYGTSQLVLSTEHINQGRWMRLISSGIYLDVVWSGTSKERETELRAVPVDLLGGLLGVRSFIIRQSDWRVFSRLTSLNELKQHTACQGQHWPDADILEHAQLPVLRTGLFASNFKMLEKGRCDYFPRGIHEGKSEVEKYRALYGEGLVLIEDVLLVYPFNMYLFVSKKNDELAELLEYGLKRAIDSGELERFYEQSSITQHLFPLSRYATKTRFTLTNPTQTAHQDHYNTWLVNKLINGITSNTNEGH